MSNDIGKSGSLGQCLLRFVEPIMGKKKKARVQNRLCAACMLEELEPRALLSSLTLAASVAGPASVQLSWTNSGVTGSGYYVMRGADMSHLAKIGTITNISTLTYTDSTAVAAHTYDYEVEAYTGTTASSPSNVVAATTPMAPPASLAATALSPTSVKLTWVNHDASSVGYNILRSIGGGAFTQINQVIGVATLTFTDTTAAADTSYSYQVEAHNTTTTSAASNTATVTTPLVAPSGLMISSTTYSSVQIAWTDNDSTAKGYNVLRSTNGTTFTTLAQLTSANAASYNDTSVVSGRTYDYKIQAVNGSVTSAASSMVAANTPLHAPTALTATVTGPTSVALAWTDNDTNAAGYIILRSSDGTNYSQLVKLTSGTANSYTDATAVAAHTYSYKVEAYAGTITSPTTNVATASTPMSPPTGLTATALSPSSVKLTWVNHDTSTVGYNILRSVNGGAFTQITQITKAATVTYTDTNLPCDTPYRYQVEAYNSSMTSAASNTAAVTTPLVAPSALTVASTGFSQVGISWTDNDQTAKGYNILRSTNGTAFTNLITLTQGNASGFVDSTVVSGRTYDYEVQAVNGSVTSAVSNMVVANTPLHPPTGVKATVNGPTSVTLSWTNNDANTAGYYILRSLDGTSYTKLGTVTKATTTSFTDTTASPSHQYLYEVQAYAGNSTSVASTNVIVSTPLATPTGLSITVVTPNCLQLRWYVTDPAAQGYNILRNTAGGAFTQVGKVTSGVGNSYIDVVSSATVYNYEVQAYNASGTSAPSAAVQVTTPLNAPSALAASLNSSGKVQLSWTDNDTAATGYILMRSTNLGAFYTQALLTNGSASNYTDTSVVSGQTYTYEIQATKGAIRSAMSNTVAANTPLSAPTGLQITIKGPNSVLLTWANNDANTMGFNVLRSTDGINYNSVGKVNSWITLRYTDNTVKSGTMYFYEVQATAGTCSSPPSSDYMVLTPMIAPSGLTTTLTGTTSTPTATLGWTDNDLSATGYIVLRSTDSLIYTPLTQVTGASANSYVDTSAAAGGTYYYEVESSNQYEHSTGSNPAVVAIPAGISGGVSMITRYGNELVITENAKNDTVSITESGTTLTINADGTILTASAPADGLFIYSRASGDSVSIDASVKAATTIDSIDGNSSTISSAGSNVSVWDDSTDSFSGKGTLHSVASFAGGASKALGAALGNPTDSGTTTVVNFSLWGAGPTAADVKQGYTGDCYFLSSLAAFAGTRPLALENMAVDLGDGTYAVQFISKGSPVYVRVSDTLPVGPGGTGYMFASPGVANTIWAPIFEKAFCYFRTGANSYASIGNGGWMAEVYTDLGVSSVNFTPSADSDSVLYALLSSDLSANDPVTMGTHGTKSPDLVNCHAYTLVSVYKDSSGVSHYVVRNPWGISGDAAENAQGYATLTYAQFVANFADGCIATS